MDKSPEYDVVILGAGPAGSTAGTYLARFMFKVLLLEAHADQPTDLTSVQTRSLVPGRYLNVPGFPHGIERKAFKWLGIEEAQKAGCDYRIDEAVSITEHPHQFEIHCQNKDYTTTAIFFAMGVEDLWPDLPGLKRFVGRSLYWSVEANGKESVGRPAAVIGYSDQAALAGIRLHQFASKTYFLTNGNVLSCSEEMKKLLTHLQIEVNERQITQISGEEALIEAISFEGQDEPTSIEVLYFPTHLRPPRSRLAHDIGVYVDAAGFIQVNERFETNINNVYAIGDITSRGPEQVITSCYQGMQAAWAFYEERFQESLQHELVVAKH